MKLLLINNTSDNYSYLDDSVIILANATTEVHAQKISSLVQDVDFVSDIYYGNLRVNDGFKNLSIEESLDYIKLLSPQNSTNINGWSTGGYVPDPNNGSGQPPLGSIAPVSLDGAQNLITRSQILSDEGAFRDDFTGSSLFHEIPGIVTFNNGSIVIYGAGTNFLSTLTKETYIRLQGDDENALVLVQNVLSDTVAVLESPYSGTSSSDTAEISRWSTHTSAGASIDILEGMVSLSSGTEAESYASIYKCSDYAPLTLTFNASVDQRIDDQEIIVGFVDDVNNIGNQAVLLLDGTDDTKITFRTSYSNNGSSETEESIVTLPNSFTTANINTYNISMKTDRCILSFNGAPLITHQLHIPDPYVEMKIVASIENEEELGEDDEPTVFLIDNFFLCNHDQIQVGSLFVGDHIPVDFPPASNSSVTRVAVCTSNVTLLAANRYRKGVLLFNDSNLVAYVKFGVDASTTSYTLQMPANSLMNLDGTPIYIGQIDCKWCGMAGTGGMQVTELT